MRTEKLLYGFKVCREHIKQLQRVNDLQTIELNAYRSILRAINGSLEPIEGNLEDAARTHNIINNIEETEKFLQAELDKTKPQAAKPNKENENGN